MLLRLTFATTFEDQPAFSSFFSLCNRGGFGHRSSNGILPLHRRKLRQRLILMRQSGDNENPGEEQPETLFMKELRRRGIPPTSKEEKSSTYSSSGTEPITKGEEDNDASSSKGTQSSGPTVKSPSGLYDEQSLSNQRQRSMAFNSEGLEGLIPRAQALLTLGGSFFLSFWPFILSSLTIFVALYVYYGPIFIHSGNDAGGRQGPYVNPYELLNNERIPSEIGPSRVPFNVR